MAAEGSYDAFISYRRSDGTRAARRLRQALRAYRLPKGLREGCPGRLAIFLDTVYERGASDFYDKTIRPALTASRWLIVVATPDAVRRAEGEDWIAREVADFSAGPNAGNVIVVRAAGEFGGALPADIAERYPNVQIVDMREDGWLSRLMPRRAARLADEKLKIVGPLFDVALEDMPRLRREEERRQMGRMGWASGFAVATAAVVVGVSLYALRSQWEGRQALVQSLRVIEGSIFSTVAQYGDPEPLGSTLRELTLQSCDVVNRLKSLSGEEPAAEATLACTVEEALALGVIGDRDVHFRAIGEALAGAEATVRENPAANDRLLTVLRAGLSGWATFEAFGEGGRPGETASRMAAFEEELAGQLAQGKDAGTSDVDLAVVLDGYARAVIVRQEAIERYQAAKDSVAAAGEMEAVRRTATAGLATLAATRGTQAYDDFAAYWWAQFAWTYYGFSLRLAYEAGTAGIDRATTLLDEAEAVYAAAPKGKDQEGRAAAVLADLNRHRALLIRRAGNPEAGAVHVWACLDRAAAASAAGLGEEEEGEGPEGGLGELARKASEACFKALNEEIDRRRAQVEELHERGDAAGAAALLGGIVADTARMEAFLPEPSPWDRLYRFAALAELAGLQDEVGRQEEAQASRIAAQEIYRPYLADIDLPDLSAAQASIARDAWDSVWKGHHAYLDRLRNATAGAPPPEALTLLETLLAADEAWDAGMPEGPTAWDDVYQAEVRVQMAGFHAAAGQAAKQAAAMQAAYARLEKYAGNFPLSGDSLQRAGRVWQVLGDWKASLAPAAAEAAVPPVAEPAP